MNKLFFFIISLFLTFPALQPYDFYCWPEGAIKIDFDGRHGSLYLTFNIPLPKNIYTAYYSSKEVFFSKRKIWDFEEYQEKITIHDSLLSNRSKKRPLYVVLTNDIVIDSLFGTFSIFIGKNNTQKFLQFCLNLKEKFLTSCCPQRNFLATLYIED